MDTSYRFDWSPPCRVPVREHAEKGGNTMVMAYVVDLQPSSSGVLELHLTDFEFLEFNGQDMTEPAMHAAMRPVLAMTAAIPAMEISVEGRYLTIRDFDRTIDELATMLAQLGVSPENVARTRAMMDTPTMRAMMKQITGQYWGTWVEYWVDWSLPPGESHEEQQVLAVPGGGQGPVTVRTEHLGIVDGRARLRLTHQIRGDSLIALFSPLLAKIAREANLDGSLDDVFRDGSREMVLTVETDPATLRPSHTRFEMTLELQLSNGERREQREVRDVTWDWKAAVGCGR